MKAVFKAEPAPGIAVLDAPEPTIRPGHVKIRVEKGAVCGTDLHIYRWDPWAQSRIHPPRLIGHEFCGTIVEIGEGVTERRVGDFVASESHIVCGTCRQCRLGQGHVCIATRILGVDVDGGFAAYAVVPEANARPTPASVPEGVAAMQDALGNAVHTVMAGPVEGCSVLITGMGPIGLFAVGICRVLGASKIIVTEVSDYRKRLAEKMGADVLIDPTRENAEAIVEREAPGGVDATLEMSGHPSQIALAVRCTRPGGRLSLLGLFPDLLDRFDMNTVIFKGLDVQGIIGRRLWQTWDQMHWLLTEKGLDVTPVITHEMSCCDVGAAMEILARGEAGKIVLDFADAV